MSSVPTGGDTYLTAPGTSGMGGLCGPTPHADTGSPPAGVNGEAGGERGGGLQSPNRILTPAGTTLLCKVWSFTKGFKPGHHIRE
jgi:hypothetical protein